MPRWVGRRMAAAMVVGCIVGGMSGPSAHAAPPDPELTHLFQLFGDIAAEAERGHSTPIDEHRAMTAAIVGFLESLDAHSAYISPTVFNEMRAGTPSASVGIQLTTENGFIDVVGVLDNSAAARAGITVGDRLDAVDGVRVDGMSLNAVVELLRGPAGKPLVLTVVRPPAPNFDVRLTRERLVAPRPSIKLVGSYAVLRISSLYGSIGDDAKTLLVQTMARSPKPAGLILDLRDCRLAASSDSIALTGLFQGQGTVYVEHGRDPSDIRRPLDQQHASTDRDRVASQVPMVVLVNTGTADGCEIIAAALQDNKRAKVVGVRTYGQGSAQIILPLNQGKDGAVKLTTNFIERPSGKPIQKRGVIPDLVVARSKEEAARFANHQVFSERTLPNAPEESGAVSDDVVDTLPEAPPAGHEGDYQLERAIALLQPQK